MCLTADHRTTQGFLFALTGFFNNRDAPTWPSTPQEVTANLKKAGQPLKEAMEYPSFRST